MILSLQENKAQARRLGNPFITKEPPSTGSWKTLWSREVISPKVIQKTAHGTFLITARKRSLGQGNIFRSVCQEFCPRGRVLPPGEGGASSWRGCLLGGGELVETPRDGYCCGRYASYWNAFLFSQYFCSKIKQVFTCFEPVFTITPNSSKKNKVFCAVNLIFLNTEN